FVLAILSLLPARAALACRHDPACATLHASWGDPPTRWAPRHDAGEARLAITSEDGNVTLIVTDQVVAVELSDRALHRVQRKLRKVQAADEDNVLATAIRTAVLSGVRALLDHSAECPVRELRDVDYRGGRLWFITGDGER